MEKEKGRMVDPERLEIVKKAIELVGWSYSTIMKPDTPHKDYYYIAITANQTEQFSAKVDSEGGDKEEVAERFFGGKVDGFWESWLAPSRGSDVATLVESLSKQPGGLDDADRIRVMWYQIGKDRASTEIKDLNDRIGRLKEAVFACLVPIAALSIDERNTMLFTGDLWAAIKRADEKLKSLVGIL